MKLKIGVIILIVLGLGFGLWAVLHGGERTHLVPAWQLTPENAYDAELLVDPVTSWSPDSSSLVLSLKGKNAVKQALLRWRVGDKSMERLTVGVSPNFTDKSHFIYLTTSPTSVVEYNLATGFQRQVLAGFGKVDFAKDVNAFCYLPDKKALALRFAGFTRYFEPGCELVSLTGKPMGKLPRLTGNGILDRSPSPDGRSVAEIIGDLSGDVRVLQTRDAQSSKGARQLATGSLGAVAWAPGGKQIAYADANEVRLIAPDGAGAVTVARFGTLPAQGDPPYVCRLSWSPDGHYLLAIELIPADEGGTAMIYVLNMGA